MAPDVPLLKLTYDKNTTPLYASEQHANHIAKQAKMVSSYDSDQS